jgi:hypothetical protein
LDLRMKVGEGDRQLKPLPPGEVGSQCQQGRGVPTSGIEHETWRTRQRSKQDLFECLSGIDLRPIRPGWSFFDEAKRSAERNLKW